jgi:hypothetical protein
MLSTCSRVALLIEKMQQYLSLVVHQSSSSYECGAWVRGRLRRSARSESGLTVDQFPGDIEVTGMPGRLLNHVQNDPAEIGDLTCDLPVGPSPRGLLATSLYEDPSAGMPEDPSARLREHPAPLRCSILRQPPPPSSVGAPRRIPLSATRRAPCPSQRATGFQDTALLVSCRTPNICGREARQPDGGARTDHPVR